MGEKDVRGMKEVFEKYLTDLYKEVPLDVYEALLYNMCIGTVLVLMFKGIRKGWIYIFGLLLVEYIVLLFFTTVFCRSYSELPKFNFIPFWSYFEIIDGEKGLLPENIMNVLVFVPVGILLGCVIRSITWKKILLIGCGISVMIEVMQFFLKKGFSEVDDVMHNTVGCIAGYGLYLLISMWIGDIRRVKCKVQ